MNTPNRTIEREKRNFGTMVGLVSEYFSFWLRRVYAGKLSVAIIIFWLPFQSGALFLESACSIFRAYGRAAVTEPPTARTLNRYDTAC